MAHVHVVESSEAVVVVPSKFFHRISHKLDSNDRDAVVCSLSAELTGTPGSNTVPLTEHHDDGDSWLTVLSCGWQVTYRRLLKEEMREYAAEYRHNGHRAGYYVTDLLPIHLPAPTRPAPASATETAPSSSPISKSQRSTPPVLPARRGRLRASLASACRHLTQPAGAVLDALDLTLPQKVDEKTAIAAIDDSWSRLEHELDDLLLRIGPPPTE